jgi:excisionase family DNA binding protein
LHKTTKKKAMEKSKITFERIPEAIQTLLHRLDKIESLLSKERQTTDEEIPITVKQAASILSLSTATLYSKVNRREIPFIKRGGRLYFSKRDLLAYINEGRVSTAEEIKNETIKSLSNG